ncbi:MAG: CPBP family intramembrane glutamic endopeptidase [Betaproteobacteria bacterium]
MTGIEVDESERVTGRAQTPLSSVQTTLRAYLVHSWDVPLTWPTFWGLVLVRLLPLAILTSLFAPPTATPVPDNLSATGLALMVVSALLVAPVLETLVFLLALNFLSDLRWDVLDSVNKRKVVCVVLGVLFGLVHFRDAFQTTILAMAGYVFLRILMEQRELGMTKSGFWWSVLAHVFFNLTVIAIGLSAAEYG